MERRELGKSGLKVSPICLGGNVFGWTADETTSYRVLDAFLDQGGNFIDTADVYSRWVEGHPGGESETVIGSWFKRGAKRERVILATKVGMEMGPGKNGLAREYIQQAVDASLRRLQTDYVDLYQSHQDGQETALEETLDAFAGLIKAGKVRAIGASNYTARRLEDAFEISRQRGIPRYESLQPLYNLVEREAYEAELEPVAEQAGVGVIPYFSLAAGFLTGKYRSEADLQNKARGRTVKKHLNDKGFRVLACLDQIARELSATPGQVALAWLMARPSITAPIASATSEQQLKELIGGASLKLGGDTIERLNEASA